MDKAALGIRLELSLFALWDPSETEKIQICNPIPRGLVHAVSFERKDFKLTH